MIVIVGIAAAVDVDVITRVPFAAGWRRRRSDRYMRSITRTRRGGPPVRLAIRKTRHG